ncbi:MAG: 23S rRNA (adenine(2503)-C(2))-methyltransferase RlmN [Planctomycetota bacterium]|nr:MAG: 23S rRNA (adenine(2503)-C(2))-methyltransferase RlmN [Planctomycetota bacterium]
MTSIHDFAAIEQWRHGHRLEAQHVRSLRTAFYKKYAGPREALAALPKAVRDDFAARFEFHALELSERFDSARDGATKLLFRTAEHLLLESVVLRPASGRTALCVSTQVGCAARCQFCATGKMGLARNLSAAEILDQIVQSGELAAREGRNVRSIVFMGMGEPFHNEEALHAALARLVDPRAFHFHPRRLLVSTVGIPRAMVRCARAWPQVRQAVSLHSARDDVRRHLMPVAARHDLTELREALAEVAALGQYDVMIEYLLLDGLTDTDDDVAALIEYLRGLRVHVNLIPFNPIAEAPPLRRSTPSRHAVVSESLKAAGFPVTTRYSLGADIAAACGQLVRDAQPGAAVAP